jgi:hypothetical protein
MNVYLDEEFFGHFNYISEVLAWLDLFPSISIDKKVMVFNENGESIPCPRSTTRSETD